MSQLLLLALLIAAARLFGGGVSGDQRRTWSGRSGGHLIAWLLAGPVWLICLLLFVVEGRTHALQLALLGATTVVLFPWPITRAVLIPLGLVRSAFWLTRIADWTWGRDLPGGAAVAAVLAASHGRAPATHLVGRWWRRHVTRPGDLAFARERVQRLDLLGAGGVVAALLLADLDDDVHDSAVRADGLAAAFAAFDPVVVPAAAAALVAERALARLVGDHRRDVDARRAAVLALDARGSATVRFCQAILRRDDDDRWPRRLACVGWWFVAARRRRSWPLLRGTARLWTTTATTTTTTTTATTSDGHDDALTLAARRHAELAGRTDVALDDVVALAALWQAGLPRALAWLRSRAVALKVDGDDAAAALAQGVRAALRTHVEPLDLGAIDLRTLPPVLQLVVDEIRSERMDALEIAVAAWRQRLEAGIDRAPVDELQEWVALRGLAAAVARTGSDGRYLAWEASQWVVCELAVRLWNVRKEHRLANAIFRTLLDEARAVGDTRAAETQAANVACGA